MNIPNLIICVVGNFTNFKEIKEIIECSDLFTLDQDYSELEPDPRMVKAFEATNDLSENSLTASDRRSIKSHSAVAYITASRIKKSNRLKMMEEALTIIEKLFLKKVACAIKIDTSGISHGKNKWLELANDASKEEGIEKLSVFYQSFVRKPLASDRGDIFSCGMHHFGKPDFIVRGKLNKKTVPLMFEAFKTTVSSDYKSDSNLKSKIKKATEDERIYKDPGDPYFNPDGYWIVTLG